MTNVFSFRSGYRAFSSYWWKYWLTLRTYTQPLIWSYQRVTRGWADCDTWSLDDHLNTWLPDALERLKSTGHGYPNELTEEKWNKILDKMAEGFRANARLVGFDDKQSWDRKADQKLWKDGMKLFVKYYNGLWD